MEGEEEPKKEPEQKKEETKKEKHYKNVGEWLESWTSKIPKPAYILLMVDEDDVFTLRAMSLTSAEMALTEDCRTQYIG